VPTSGPSPPPGGSANRLPTHPERRCETLFRFYGPEPALFDKTWQLPEGRPPCNGLNLTGVPRDMTDRTEHRDPTATLVSHAAAWSSGNAEPEVTATPSDLLTDRPLTTDERSVALRSARYASHAYPGPMGELISSRIHEYVLDGKLLESFSLPRRLVRSMQTMEARSPLPPLGGYDYLPATYMPGSPGRWRYRTSAGGDQDPR
jgi:hypothetical protein